MSPVGKWNMLVTNVPPKAHDGLLEMLINTYANKFDVLCSKHDEDIYYTDRKQNRAPREPYTSP